MKWLRFLLATLGYLALLSATYVVHIKYFKVDVVFYSALFDGVLASCLLGLITWKAAAFRIFSTFEKTQMIVLWLLIGYALAISVPTVLDRSLSFYTLEKLQQRGGAIQQSAFEDIYAKEYVKEHRLVDVRLTEQERSGTIVIEEGCVKLTAKGELIATISRYFRNNFLPKERLLRGEYTSDLTNPFRNSRQVVDYVCK